MKTGPVDDGMRTLWDSIYSELQSEGATTARVIAGKRGQTRAAYESARRALRAWPGLVVHRYDVWDAERERWERTDTIYGRDRESCERFAEFWAFHKLLSSDVVTAAQSRPAPLDVVADAQHRVENG